ncbi:MAG: alpha/beta hydrolase, partial [Caulobacteraceae bacterium]
MLRAALFAPEGPVRGSVILSPGRTEPIEKYYEVIGELHQRGLMVLAHDWRGQGGSHRMHNDRLAGHAVRLDDFIEDYRRLLTVYGPRLPRPWISLSHSMGGCFSLLAAEAGVGPMDALAMTSPMLSIRMSGALKRMSRQLVWLLTTLGLSGRPLPGAIRHPLDDHFEFDKLTHDHRRYLAAKEILRANP